MASDASGDDGLGASGDATMMPRLDKGKGRAIYQAPAMSPMRPAGTGDLEMLSRPFELTGAFGDTAFVQGTGLSESAQQSSVPLGNEGPSMHGSYQPAFNTAALEGSHECPQSVYASTSQQQQAACLPVFPLPYQHDSLIDHHLATCFAPQSQAPLLCSTAAAMLTETVDTQYHVPSLGSHQERTSAQPFGAIVGGIGGTGSYGCGFLFGPDDQTMHDPRPSPHVEMRMAIPPDAGRNFALMPTWAHYGLQFHIGDGSPFVEEGERPRRFNTPRTGGCEKAQDESVLTRAVQLFNRTFTSLDLVCAVDRLNRRLIMAGGLMQCAGLRTSVAARLLVQRARQDFHQETDIRPIGDVITPYYRNDPVSHPLHPVSVSPPS